VAVFALAALLGACASPRDGGYYQDDGPPADAPLNLASVAEPVPRAEPRSRYGNNPYEVFGRTYRPLRDARGYREQGTASWYGKKFHGKRTSSGETYNMYSMTAAHRTLPLPSYVRVRNLANNRSVVVRVNDRGPFHSSRLIDLSYAAAHRIGLLGTGTARVEVVALEPGTGAPGPAPAEYAASGRIFLQIGAFADWNTAERVRRRAAGTTTVRTFVDVVERAGRPLYRVRMGPLASQQLAQRVARQLAGAGLTSDLMIE
jgi:rare lipoprotein A